MNWDSFKIFRLGFEKKLFTDFYSMVLSKIDAKSSIKFGYGMKNSQLLSLNPFCRTEQKVMNGLVTFHPDSGFSTFDCHKKNAFKVFKRVFLRLSSLKRNGTTLYW